MPLAIGELPLAEVVDDFQLMARRSTRRRSSTTLPAAASSPSGAMSFWSPAPVPADPSGHRYRQKLYRDGTRGHFYNVVVRRPARTETRDGRQGRLAEHLTRMDFVVLDELGYLPFAQIRRPAFFHLVSRLYERTSFRHYQSCVRWNGRACSAMPR